LIPFKHISTHLKDLIFIIIKFSLFISEVAAILRRFPARHELSLEAALTFCTTPRGCEAVFFLGQEQPKTPLSGQEKKRKAEQTIMSSKGKRTKITPTDSVNIHKYKSGNTENANFLNKADLAKNLPAAMQNKKWIKEFSNLNSSAVATQTWKKYNAAYAKFQNFTQDTNTKYTWPLSNAVVNGFVTWCGTTQNLSHNTVKAYIFALSKIQKMKSFGPITFAKSLAENLNKGLQNLSTKKPQKFNTVSFNNLKLL